MRYATLIILFGCSLVCFNCSSAADTVLIRQRIEVIKSWRLTYATSNQVTSNLSSQQIDRNLRLLDLITDILTEKSALTVVQDPCATCGQIKLITSELNGRVEYVDIALYDPNDQQITRSRLWNDVQAKIAMSRDIKQNNISFNEGLAGLIAGRIADMLAGKQIPGSD